MVIFVKTLTGTTITIDIKSTETILNLKKKIKLITGMSVKQQRLLCHGKQLSNGLTLEYYKIKNEDTIHLCLALRGGGGFNFATMENLRQIELIDDGPEHLTITKKGLFLVGICTNDRCVILNNEYVSSQGMGIFDAEYLNNNCICPKCNLQSNHKEVGFYECDFYVKGVTSASVTKEFHKSVNGCEIEKIKSDTKWTSLEIKVVKKSESTKFSVKISNEVK